MTPADVFADIGHVVGVVFYYAFLTTWGWLIIPSTIIAVVAAFDWLDTPAEIRENRRRARKAVPWWQR